MTETVNRRYGERVVDLVDRLTRAVRQLEFSSGLNPAQWEALRYLWRANQISRTPAALADWLGATRGTVSQTINCLEGKGLVRKVRCEQDRRVTFLELTGQGTRLLEHDPLHCIDAFAADLPDETGSTLVDGLTELLCRLSPAGGCKSFGICTTCCHLREPSDATIEAGRCGLSGAALSERDTGCLCVNYAPEKNGTASAG